MPLASNTIKNLAPGMLALACGLIILLGIVWPAASAALSAAQIKAFNLGIYYYNTEESSPTCSTSVSLTGSDNQQKAYNYFVAKGLTPAQSAGLVGNLIAESGLNPKAKQNISDPARGIGIAQWSENDRWVSENKFAQQQGKDMYDLGAQLGFVWQELTTGYKSALQNLKATTDVQGAAVSVLQHYEIAYDKSSNGPNSKIRGGLAQGVLTRYGGAASDSASGGSTAVDSGTGCASGAAAGSIVQTALNYAWSDRNHGPNESDAKPSYQTDMPKYNGSTGETPFADCGVFTSTVMIASGADPNYPKRRTIVQEAYLKAHPELYQQLPDPTDTSSLQPGDILINTVHTYIFVGKQSAGYNSVGASLGQHVPQASNFYGGFQLFRPISSGAGNSDSSQS